jgi:HlyD family secretion protein
MRILAANARALPAVDADLPVEPDWRPTAWIGLMIVLAFVLGFGVWAAFAPLSSAAIAPGQVKAEGDRRTVQHLEGGIVREFLVREGDRVRAGQPLLRLDDTQAGASADVLSSQLDAFRAVDARLTAEATEAQRVIYPPEILARRGEPRIAEMLTAQDAIFANRAAALASQVNVLSQRIEQSQAEIRSYQAQATSNDRQLTLTRDELNGVEQLVSRGYERRPRLLQLQRQAAELEGTRNQQRELITRAQRAIAEAEGQIASLRSDRQRDIANDQNDTQSRIAEAQERLRAASDVRRRLEVAAPIGGIVANLHFFTIGAVVRPGEPILDIVPLDEALVVEGQVNPADIENVTAGLRAEVRLVGMRRRVVPVLVGEVIYVAADVSMNERTNNAYYKATIRIPPEQMRLLDGTVLQPGMPTEVYILAARRTMLGYLFQPLRDSFNRAFRER